MASTARQQPIEDEPIKGPAAANDNVEVNDASGSEGANVTSFKGNKIELEFNTNQNINTAQSAANNNVETSKLTDSNKDIISTPSIVDDDDKKSEQLPSVEKQNIPKLETPQTNQPSKPPTTPQETTKPKQTTPSIAQEKPTKKTPQITTQPPTKITTNNSSELKTPPTVTPPSEEVASEPKRVDKTPPPTKRQTNDELTKTGPHPTTNETPDKQPTRNPEKFWRSDANPNANKRIPPSSQQSEDKTPPIIKPDQVSNNFNSQQLKKPEHSENYKNDNKPLGKLGGEPLAKDSKQEKDPEWEKMMKAMNDKENQEERAYQKLNALGRFNRTRQQKKILKQLKKKNDKLIGIVERMILTNYFPIVTQKIVDHQAEVGGLLKLLSKKKIIYRKDSVFTKLWYWEIPMFEYYVIDPVIKNGYFRDSIRRFRNYWLSWAVEFWWWTVILAITDLLFIFPIFLLMTSIFDGPGVRWLKKVKKRNQEMKELCSSLYKIAKPKGGDGEGKLIHHTGSWDK